jgi:hypothetical protein
VLQTALLQAALLQEPLLPQRLRLRSRYGLRLRCPDLRCPDLCRPRPDLRRRPELWLRSRLRLRQRLLRPLQVPLQGSLPQVPLRRLRWLRLRQQLRLRSGLRLRLLIDQASRTKAAAHTTAADTPAS